MKLRHNAGFRRLGLMYLLLYVGEGLIAIYLFNAIKAAGLTTVNSSIVFIATYLPNLVLSRLLARYTARLGGTRVLRIAAACRAAACLCFALIPHGTSLLYTVGFVVVMEAMWFFMMPVVDGIQGAVLPREKLARGESILTALLQIALFVSLSGGGIVAERTVPGLLIGAGTLQIGIAALGRSGTGTQAPEADGQRAEASPAAARARVPARLFTALALVLAFPQMLNILLPLKAFTTYDSNATLGIIDSMYNLGALISGLSGAWLLAKVLSSRRTVLITLLLTVASVSIWVFSVSGRALTDVATYFVLGLAMSTTRILLRTMVFEMAPRGDTSAYFTMATRYSLVASLAGSIVIGVVGERFGWQVAYMILPAMCVSGIALIVSFRTRMSPAREAAMEKSG
jgi:MFS family permease